VTEGNRVKGKDGKADKYIVQLKAIPEDKLEALKELFKDGKTEVPIREMRPILLSANLWVNNPEYPPTLPMRDEEVYVNINYVDNKERNKKVLRATDIQMKPATTGESMDWDKFLSNDQPPVDQETGAVITHVKGNDDITH
jgi:hypothetical protein